MCLSTSSETRRMRFNSDRVRSPGGELHDRVETIRAVVYLVGQLAAAPVVRLPGLAARALDDRTKTPDRVLDLLLVELGYHYEHGFVSVDVCLLRSSVGFFR